jgi:uncharacterized protein (TIGR01777 family)
MKVLVSGSSGLLGSAIISELITRRHQVARLVRAANVDPIDVTWNPSLARINLVGLEGHDAVIHLAGENISGRWTKAKKDRIRESRTAGTRLLADSLAGLSKPPRVLVSASAVGYYGNRGDELLDEESAAGSDFLAEVCREWEEATSSAREQGIRVVRLRLGVVLSASGGALAKMLTPFRLGLGGRMGTGKQFMSWITLADVASLVSFLLDRENIEGPVNAVAPHPVRNSEFTKALATALHRPAVFPMPAAAARVAFGEMADALLLSSARVQPRRLTEAGYPFLHPTIEQAIHTLLGR